METQNDDALAGKFGDGLGVKSVKTKSENSNQLLLKQGETVFRVLPPMFSAVQRNIWAAFYARHWIVCNNGNRLPVMCTKIYDRESQKFLDTCRFCREDEPKRQLCDKTYMVLKDKKAELESNKDKLSEEDLIVLQDELEGAKDAYQVARSQYSPIERKFWVNAMTQDGKVQLCGLPKTVYEALVGKKEKNEKFRKGGLFEKLLKTQELDAVGVNGGAWVVVNRTGSDQFNTEYQVSALTEVEVTEVNGKKRTAEYLKECPLSDAQKTDCLKYGKDLNTVFDHLKLTTEEQGRFIDSGYDYEVLVSVFNSKRPLAVQDLT